MFAGGTGILPLMQILDHYLHRGESAQFFHAWFVKSPKYIFEAILGLKELEKKSGGCFKWVVFYTSNKTEEEQSQDIHEDSNNRITSMFKFFMTKIKKSAPSLTVPDIISNSTNKIPENEGRWSKGF